MAIPFRSAKGAFTRSPKGVFGGGGLVEIARTSEVLMTWECTFVRYNTVTNAKLDETPGTVLLHDRYYHNVLWLMGSSAGRGSSTGHGNLLAEAFSSGSPDAVNDLHSSNGLTPNADVTTSAWLFLGWPPHGAEPGFLFKQPFEDTGSALEFHGRIEFASSLADGVDADIGSGAYGRAPFTALDYPDPNEHLDWILAYFTGGSGVNVKNDAAGGDIHCDLRIKVTITA